MPALWRMGAMDSQRDSAIRGCDVMDDHKPGAFLASVSCAGLGNRRARPGGRADDCRAWRLYWRAWLGEPSCRPVFRLPLPSAWRPASSMASMCWSLRAYVAPCLSALAGSVVEARQGVRARAVFVFPVFPTSPCCCLILLEVPPETTVPDGHASNPGCAAAINQRRVAIRPALSAILAIIVVMKYRIHPIK